MLLSFDHIQVKIPNRLEFWALIRQFSHIDGYSTHVIIMMGGKHIGFLNTSRYFQWHNKACSRMTVIAALDSSSITV